MTTPTAPSGDVHIAVIGGSGVYRMDGVTNTKEVEVSTPYGRPSSKLFVGELDGVKVVFLARHDVGHRLLPSEVPFRANIWALKSLGVKYLVSITAVGSLQEECKPLDIVLPDQFIDRTKHRADTFFGEGIVAHVSFGEPTCKQLRSVLYEAATHANLPGVQVHQGGTYVCIEGPAFSTKAESNMYRMFNGTVVGMTALQEAKLAREAEIAFCSLCFVTDYDCWHPEFESVSSDMVLANLHTNGANVQIVIRDVIRRLGANEYHSENVHDSLKTSIVTSSENVSKEVRTKLWPIIGRYFPAQ